MSPFSRIISFLSWVLGSRRLTIVDDLDLPLGSLCWYATKSPGRSKPFVDFNTSTSVVSNCHFDLT